MRTFNNTQNNQNASNKLSQHSFVCLSMVCIILVIVLGAFLIWSYARQQSQIAQLNSDIQSLSEQLTNYSSSPYITSKGEKIYVFTPTANSKVASSIAVFGVVPGSWAFENVFPIQIANSEGEVIAQVNATLTGTWMTTDFQLFTATITIPDGQSGNGTLILQDDNPSGLTQNEDSISIPIQF